MRNICVSDLNKIAHVIEVASEGKHPSTTMQSLAGPLEPISHLEEGKLGLTTIVSLTSCLEK